jgi:hypothetical protein
MERKRKYEPTSEGEPDPDEEAAAQGLAKKVCTDLQNMEGRQGKRCCDHCMHSGCLGILPYDGETEDLPVNIPGLVIANSKQQGGKSHLLRYISYKHRQRFHYGIAFSNSKDDGDNLDWFPKKYQHTFLRTDDPKTNGEAALQALIDQQKKFPRDRRPLAFVIIDDDRSGFNSNVLKMAATQVYKYNLWIWISVHNVSDLSAGIREQATNVAIFETSTANSLAQTYKNYGQDYRRQKDFEQVIQCNTGGENTPNWHNFLWKDVKKGTPWKVFRCPPVVPKFFINYGEEEEVAGA